MKLREKLIWRKKAPQDIFHLHIIFWEKVSIPYQTHSLAGLNPHLTVFGLEYWPFVLRFCSIELLLGGFEK